MIATVPYRSAWRTEFASLGRELREVLGDLALRIDHIGSTLVPGLSAKDAYYAVKDPVCDIIMGGAEAWAAQVGWKPNASDC